MSTKDLNQTFNSIHTRFKFVWVQLLAAKAAKNQNNFNKLMMDALPEMEKYVSSRLRLAHHKGALPDGKYEVNDFVNTLFIEAYDHFSEFDTARDFSNWLYIKMDELIEDQITDEDFDDFFFNDFGNYSTAEWEVLEEKADEADQTGNVEITQPKRGLTDTGKKVLAAIFKSDDEQQHLASIQEKVPEQAIHTHLNLVLKHLPKDAALTLKLAVDQELDPKDVASIRKKSEAEVKADLEKSKALIRESFKSRYKDIVM